VNKNSLFDLTVSLFLQLVTEERPSTKTASRTPFAIVTVILRKKRYGSLLGTGKEQKL